MKNPFGEPTDGARRRGDILTMLRRGPLYQDEIWGRLKRAKWAKLHTNTVQNDLAELYHQKRIKVNEKDKVELT